MEEEKENSVIDEPSVASGNSENLVSKEEIVERPALVKDKKSKKKIIIALVIIIVLIVGLAVYFLINSKDNKETKKDNAKEENVPAEKTMHEIMDDYGKLVEEKIKELVDAGEKIKEVPDVTLEDFEVSCEEKLYYEDDNTFYLGKCSINKSDETYSYGSKKEDIEEEVYSTKNWQTFDFKRKAIYKTQYFEIDADDYLEWSICTSNCDTYQELEEEEDEVAVDDRDINDVKVSIKVEKSKAYFVIKNEKVELNVSNVKKALISDDMGCSEDMFSVYILTNDGKVYIYENDISDYPVFGTLDDFKDFIKNMKFALIKDSRSYKDIKLYVNSDAFSTCGAEVTLKGVATDDKEYFINDNTASGNCFESNFFTVKEGSGNLIYSSSKSEEVTWNKKPRIIFSYEEEIYIVSDDLYIYAVDDYEGIDDEIELCKKSKISSVEHRLNGDDTEFIIKFEDGKKKEFKKAYNTRFF